MQLPEPHREVSQYSEVVTSATSLKKASLWLVKQHDCLWMLHVLKSAFRTSGSSQLRWSIVKVCCLSFDLSLLLLPPFFFNIIFAFSGNAIFFFPLGNFFLKILPSSKALGLYYVLIEGIAMIWVNLLSKVYISELVFWS